MITPLLLSLAMPSWSSATGTDEVLSNIEMVPPVVVFVVDLSSDMDSPCDGSTTGNPCIEQRVIPALSLRAQRSERAS